MAKHIASKAVHTAGSIVWWNLASGVKVGALAEALEDHGVDWVRAPSAPTPEVALKRAMDYLVERRRLLRPLEKRGQWSLVNEEADGDVLKHDQTLTVKLGGKGLELNPSNHPLVKDTHARFEYEQLVYSYNDISGWLAGRVMASCDGVHLAEHGAFYFIRTGQMDNWLSVTSSVEEAARKSQVKVKFYDLAPIMDPDKIDQVLDCVAREAQGVLDDIDKDIENGKIGERGLEGRLDVIKGIRDKVRRFEEAMKKNLPDFQEKVDALSARVSVAIITAAGGE